jgi:signal transduction histidine kinase
LRQERDALESRNALELERTRIARDLHDSLGSTLSEISLLSSIAQSSAQPTRDLWKIEQRARECVEALEDIVWATNPQADTVRSFIDHASRFATEFLTTAGIRITISAPQEIRSGKMQAAVRHNVFLAFKEALNNVVKHARATEVRIAFDRRDDRLGVLVSDNGLGTCPRENAGGADGSECHGLRNMRTRLTSVGGLATVESHPDQGTRIRFEIPL